MAKTIKMDNKSTLEKSITLSKKTLSKITKDLEQELESENYSDLCVYACGSLGRFEMTNKSDLDLFFIIKENSDLSKNNTRKYEFFGKLLDISNQNGFKEPSNNGEYWVFTKEDDLLDIGSREEDFINSFTARLLLLLESKPLFNEPLYNALIEKAVKKYFNDYEGHENDFYPLFLMNDVLRYWYTLTLNYEYRRDKNADREYTDRKRLKLKYARLLTCFSFIACLYEKNIDADYVIKCAKMTPIERLTYIADKNHDLKETVNKIIASYEKYLLMRENGNSDLKDEIMRKKAYEEAESFHDLVVKEFMSKVSAGNADLKRKVDIY